MPMAKLLTLLHKSLQLLHKLLRLLYNFLQLKQVRRILILVFSLFFVILMWHAYVSVKEWQFFNDHYTVYQHRILSKHCDIPQVDPFDETVLPYIQYRKPLKCKFIQPELTYMDYDGVLYLNQTVLAQHNLNPDFLTCYYTTLTRKEGNDDEVVYDPERVLKTSVKLNGDREFVSVRCKYRGQINYTNHHWYVPKRPIGVEINDHVAETKPQVFILVIESMSRINAIRHLPKTYSYLTKVMKSEVLRGLTKVADNSFVNMVPFLTGRKVYAKPSELPGNEKVGPYDVFPFLWKNFSKAGYITALTEDNPEFTLFNYLAKGFWKQPTDFYPRPLWVSLFNSPLFKQSRSFCFGSITSYNILFNWVKEFVIKYSRKLYFLFSFYIAIAHNDFNDARYIDSDLFELLRELNENGHFEHSVVIVMGDHGNRYGEILRTKIGHIEERMPLFSIKIPAALEKRHPHLRRYLQSNSDQLTTWFDIYALLMDIATSTYTESRAIHVWNTRGYSPWRMLIPKNRTCKDAGVPFNYCICQKETEISEEDPRIVEASNDLVSHLNAKLEIMKPFCVNLTLNTTLKAVVLLPMESIARKQGFTFQVRVQVSLKPSGGLVEAVLEKTAWSSTFKVVGDVSRLNKYGNQSACIKHRVLRKFCYCKK